MLNAFLEVLGPICIVAAAAISCSCSLGVAVFGVGPNGFPTLMPAGWLVSLLFRERRAVVQFAREVSPPGRSPPRTARPDARLRPRWACIQ